MYMRKELEGARYSNSALLDNNSNLQVEIDSLNNHIRVITHQNEELTKELDQFVFQSNHTIKQIQIFFWFPNFSCTRWSESE